MSRTRTIPLRSRGQADLLTRLGGRSSRNSRAVIDLAARLEIPPGMLERYLTGGRVPSFERRLAIERLTGITVYAWNEPTEMRSRQNEEKTMKETIFRLTWKNTDPMGSVDGEKIVEGVDAAEQKAVEIFKTEAMGVVSVWYADDDRNGEFRGDLAFTIG